MHTPQPPTPPSPSAKERGQQLERFKAINELLRSERWFVLLLMRPALFIPALLPWPLHRYAPNPLKRSFKARYAVDLYSNYAVTMAAIAVACTYGLADISARLLTSPLEFDPGAFQNMLLNGVAITVALVMLGISFPGSNLFHKASANKPEMVLYDLFPFLWGILAAVTGLLALPFTDLVSAAAHPSGRNLLLLVEVASRFLAWFGVVSLGRLLLHILQTFGQELLYVSYQSWKKAVAKEQSPPTGTSVPSDEQL